MSTRRSFLTGALAAGVALALGRPRVARASAFPPVRARNLLREDIPLPGGFAESSRNVVFVVFSRQQQDDVDTWKGPIEALAGESKQLQHWQATLMGDVGTALRGIVESAMRGIIKDEETRRRYLLLYGDKPPMLAGFGHPREDEILVLLLDASGDVLWRGHGAWNERTEAGLREAMRA